MLSRRPSWAPDSSRLRFALHASVAWGAGRSTSLRPCPSSSASNPERPDPDTLLERGLAPSLDIDPSVATGQVDVSVTRGVVTLTGSVESILGKRRALSTVRATPGVRAVVDLVAVVPVNQPDAALRD